MELPDNEKNDADNTSIAADLMAESGLTFSKEDAEAEKPAEEEPEKSESDEAAGGSAEDKKDDKEDAGDADKKKENTSQRNLDSGGTPAGGDDEDIPDEKLLAAINKKTGRDYKSLDEVGNGTSQGAADTATDDEKKLALEQTRSEAIEFGKANKLFTQSQYDEFVTFSGKDAADVVQDSFVKKIMAENPDALTEEDARDLFNEFYHIFEDEDSIKYKQGQKSIAREYDEIKKSQFSPILDVSDLYSSVQKDTQRATAYKGSVDKIFEEKLPTKFDFTIGDKTVSYAMDLKDKNIAKIVSDIKQDYLTVPMMNATLDQTGKLDEPVLLGLIKKDLQIAMLEKMVSEVATSYSDVRLTEAKMGRRGAIDLTEETRTDGSGKQRVLSESDKLLMEADIGYKPK